MIRRPLVLTLAACAILLGARDTAAQSEGQPCVAEPTDQVITYGTHLNTCEIGVLGDADLFRFQGVAGEFVVIRVTDQAGSFSRPACVLELFRPDFTPVTSLAGNTQCEILTTLATSGLFLFRVSESGNDDLMTYTVELDRLVPASTTAVPLNPGDILIDRRIEPLGDADLFTFAGTSGTTISLRVTDQAGSFSRPGVEIDLFRPDGSLVTTVSDNTIAVIDATLDQTGVHTLRVAEVGNDDLMLYNVEYQCLIGNCQPASQHTLTVLRNGAGTVTSNPAGINCGADCSETYAAGTVVTLTATPDPGASFVGFTGDPDCTDGSVTMNAARTCTATFQTSTSAPPTSADDAYSTPFNTPLTIAAPGVLANDTTNGGGTMTTTLVTNVTRGVLSLAANGAFTYTPNSGYAGPDSFVYRASNSAGPGNTATVSLTVTPLPPTSTGDAFTVTANTQLTVAAPGVLGNDSANGGGALTATLVSNVTSGTLALSVNGGFTYSPALNFVGADSFTYRAVNSVGPSGTATVTIAVTAPTTPQPPTALAVDSVTGTQVTLRFTPPVLGPAPTGYLLRGGALPGQIAASIATGSTVPLFTFTAPAGSFYVRMHTLAGTAESGASNEVPLHVQVPVAPSAPTNLIAWVNGSSLALVWQNTFTGGPPADIRLDVTGSLTSSLSVGLAEGFSFTPVPVGTYTMTVRAVNAGGVSAPSNAVTLTFPGACSGAPQMPSSVLAYRTGGTIFIRWRPPDTGPAPTQYIVHVSGSFTGAFATTLRALSGPVGPGTYSLRVQATNPCGASGLTAPVTVTVP